MADLTRLPDQAQLILASASTARTRLLSDAGVAHICDPADIDEAELKADWLGSPEGLAEHLAIEKARAISVRHAGKWVIGADQVLALKNIVFDKPKTKDKARTQLLQLRGCEHRLISAVALIRDEEVMWSQVDTAVLKMRLFSEAFLDQYLNQVETGVFFSVGGYHLEGLGAQLFEHVDGDYFTVLGLPLMPLLATLRSHQILTQ